MLQFRQAQRRVSNRRASEPTFRIEWQLPALHQATHNRLFGRNAAKTIKLRPHISFVVENWRVTRVDDEIGSVFA